MHLLVFSLFMVRIIKQPSWIVWLLWGWHKRKWRFCWAQSVDMRDPWISLRNLWIASSRRNPWMFAQSMDFA